MQKLAFALLSFGLAAVAAQVADAADLSVRLEGLRNPEGFVRFAIFDKPETFAKSGKQVVNVDVPAAELASGKLVSVFENLAPGVYAMVAHHDENANRKFDTTFIGLPTEGYGFSNDAEARLSAPPFAEAAFVLDEQDGEASFRIVYWPHTGAASSDGAR